MPIKINEMNAINENAFIYEDRIKSPSARLLDTTQTYTNYFHINNNETTTDAGFIDVEEYLGNRSPVRFGKIENFPIYGLEQIVIQLQEDDIGLDGNYEGEAIILPGTIKPVQNDFFTIPILKDSYVFRVTDIQYDNVMPDNFYKITFKLEYIDSDYIKQLEEQTVDEYVCVLDNYGTEEKCIIEKYCFTKVKEIQNMYQEIIEFYKALFYNERHNVFLGDGEMGRKVYDPLQTEFINKHQLFNEKNNLECLILTDEVEDPQRKLKYAKSMYRLFEIRDLKLLTPFKYTLRDSITLHESSFYRWHEKRIDVMDIPNHIPSTAKQILSDEFVDAVMYNTELETEYGNLIKRFLRKEELGIKDISLQLGDELLYLNNSLEVFFFTPIIMYIIREIVKEELKKEK